MDIDEELNYFSTPKFDSVIDRYYTRLYKIITPSIISALFDQPSRK